MLDCNYQYVETVDFRNKELLRNLMEWYIELCRIDKEWQSWLELLWIESQLQGIELECELEQSELNRNLIKASDEWM